MGTHSHPHHRCGIYGARQWMVRYICDVSETLLTKVPKPWILSKKGKRRGEIIGESNISAMSYSMTAQLDYMNGDEGASAQ